MQEFPEEGPAARDHSLPSPHEQDRSFDHAAWHKFEDDWRQYEGERAAEAAVRLGFIGLFVFGIVLGPWALARVWRAESFGIRTELGERLGWAATFFGLVHLTFGCLLLSL